MRVSTKNRTSIAIFIFEIWTGITAFSIKSPPGWWRQMLGEWSIENEKYADFLGIWYKNLQIWPQIKKLLRNFETSKWKIFKQLKVSINLQFIIKKNECIHPLVITYSTYNLHVAAEGKKRIVAG